MVDIPINDVTPRNRYVATNGQTVFDYDFPILDADHIKVQETDPLDLNNPITLVRGVDYNVTGVGDEIGGTIVLLVGEYPTGATADDIYTLTRELPYERLNDYQFSGDFESTDVNTDFDTVVMMVQQLNRLLIGSARLDDTDELTSLPIKIENAARRASRVFVFNATGDGIETGPTVGEIETVGANMANINTVAGSIANVNTVAGSITAVNTVSTNIANVNTVASNIANVNTVAANITNVNTVATNITAVNTAATNIAAIIDAPNQASAAAGSAAAAATSASQAATAANAMAFRDVVFITSANSPYTVTQALHNGKMISVDTSGGNVIINLPTISGLTFPFVTAVKKSTSDTNTVTVNRASTDTINDGATTSKVYNSVGGSTYIPDTDPSPDRWTTVDFGASAADEKRQSYTAGVDFTAGSTTTLTLTNAPIAGASAGLDIVFDGITQIASEWSYNPTTGVITFTEAIPSWVKKVEARWRSSLPVGITSDGSVTWAKLASGIIASVAQMLSGAANFIISAANFKTYMDTYVNKGLARAWGSFDGTSFTVRETYNCSITKTSTGLYAVVFTTPLASAFYSVNVTLSGADAGAGYWQAINRTVNGFSIDVENTGGTNTDLDNLGFQVFGGF